MPARKPSGLIERHETAAERRARVAREDALRPGRGLSVNPPAALKAHPAAQKAWRRLMRLFNDLEAEIVTRLDMDLLLEYCLCLEQIGELDEMRKKLLDAEEQDIELFVKIDARADRKRDHLLKLRQSLYLTPRARAGAAPAQKEKAPPPDDMELLLSDVTSYVNGGQ